MNQDLRILVRGAYDIQHTRIQTGNRIVGNFKAKLGQEPGEKEEDMDDDAKAMLADLRRSYSKITDGVTKIPRQKNFTGHGLISTYTEFCLLRHYLDLETVEVTHFKMLKNVLKSYPIYTEFLEPTKGIGPAMAAVIISEIDIHKAKYPSSLHKLAGLDVAEDGKGRSKRKEHLVEVEYIDKDGNPQTKMSITYKPFLKTKLVGVLGGSFLKAGDNPYSKIYRDYKNRLENHPNHQEKSKGHRHNMAIRYMVKMFLIDLHIKWRELEGLEVFPPYEEAKLGLKHGRAI